MNIHYIVGPEGYAKVTTAQYRQKTGERKPTSKGTQPPRTRTNVNTVLPHNAYPGGKRLRKAMANLKRRQDARDATCGMTSGGKGRRTINALAFQMPGSMRMRG